MLTFGAERDIFFDVVMNWVFVRPQSVLSFEACEAQGRSWSLDATKLSQELPVWGPPATHKQRVTVVDRWRLLAHLAAVAISAPVGDSDLRRLGVGFPRLAQLGSRLRGLIGRLAAVDF